MAYLTNFPLNFCDFYTGCLSTFSIPFNMGKVKNYQKLKSRRGGGGSCFIKQGKGIGALIL